MTNSVTTLDNRTVTVPLISINHHFVCVLCDGYLREAHTIPECLHSFCKSCIYRHFLIYQERTCPKCNLLLKPCPITTLVSDQQIQNLLDCVWPELLKQDAIQEKEFYSKYCFVKKPASAITTANGKGTKSRASHSKLKALRNEYRLSFQEPEIIHISLRVIPLTAGIPALLRPYLSVSGSFRIHALRKYICRQLSMEEETTIPKMEIRCLNSTVGQELSMYFIQRTIWYHHRPNVSTIILKYVC
uniref:Uncharacterized protein AlNc14C150G7513 n=1 Tax=Albugo laibachii Nc14 TaxID=890382 RepID=F0WM00_9STRA|nr:conserved hypothetical protein [Albugo laibachii Nc14]|eukprot:CCA22327.1 conserved hypothetical protein [Albugo laibachii Nc14]